VFKKILIANRGEIACRIARTCHRLGIAVAGVHSSADANALHVKEIGESIEIGGGRGVGELPANRCGHCRGKKPSTRRPFIPASAFWPKMPRLPALWKPLASFSSGRRPRSSNGSATRRPPSGKPKPRRCRSSPAAKRRARDPAEIDRIVRELKPPVMLKPPPAARQGHARRHELRLVLPAKIESAMREAKNSFGYAGLIVEKLVERGRHIEVQIAATAMAM